LYGKQKQMAVLTMNV